MKLATVRTDAGNRAVRVEGETLIDVGATDVGALLAQPGWRDQAAGDGPEVASADVTYAPLVPRPGKIICVGLNYATHIREMGRDLPEYPTLFAKFAESLIGANDPLELPAASDQVDWEAELALVVGQPVRRADSAAAADAIAGFSVSNDVTTRDWQYRTKQWLQGKTFEATTPLGPVLVTPDELPGGTSPDLQISCHVGDDEVQSSRTSDLAFGPVELLRYISEIITLQPGDVVITGTPGGVGHARTPARYLRAGETLITTIEGIGRTANAAEAAS